MSFSCGKPAKPAAWAAGLFLLLPGGTVAAAHWSSTAIGAGSAQTATLNPPTGVSAVQPDPAVAAARISWSPPGPPSVLPIGYFVERRKGDAVTPACGSAPDDHLDATTCLDQGLLPGDEYSWRVVAVFRSWTAASAQSGPLTIQPATVLAVGGVAPVAGPVGGGTEVTVSGSGFVGGASVVFGGRAASQVEVIDGDTVRALTPRGRVGSVDLTVTNPDGTSVTLPGGFTYLAEPRVLRVAPVEGPVTGGTAVTVSGREFAAGAIVRFGESPAAEVSVVDSRTIIAVSPAGAPGPVALTVTTAGGVATLGDAFTYRAAATLAATGVTPTDDPTPGSDEPEPGSQPSSPPQPGPEPAEASDVPSPAAPTGSTVIDVADGGSSPGTSVEAPSQEP